MANHIAATAGTAHDRPTNLVEIGRVHGILMLIAFAIFFPLGGAFLRSFNRPWTARVHALWQLIALFLAIAGLGTGLYVSKNGGHGVLTSKNGHKQIGITVMIIMFIQPFIGTAHHFIWKKKEAPTVYGVAHRWLGRSAVIMGLINIGLGLMLGPPHWRQILAYAVLAAVFGTIYVVATLQHEFNTLSRNGRNTNVPIREGSVDTTSTTVGPAKDTDVEKEDANNVRLREL